MITKRKVNADKVKRKERSKYNFKSMVVDEAFEVKGKTQNQIQAAVLTLIKYHKKIGGVMQYWEFEVFETAKSTKENPITVIKRVL